MPGRERDGDDPRGGREDGPGRHSTGKPEAKSAPEANRPAVAQGDQEGRTTATRNETTTTGVDTAKSIRRVRAGDVLGPRGILLIEHEGEVYTLRVTRNNRLILTK